VGYGACMLLALLEEEETRGRHGLPLPNMTNVVMAGEVV